MTTVLDALKAACVKVGGPKPGTGYLVAPNRIATCYHVVDLWEEGESHEVQIGYPNPIICQAEVVAKDQVTDCAILSVEPAGAAAPLLLASELGVRTHWEGYGFPHSANGVGIPMSGEVLDPSSKDDTGRPIMQLYSDQAAAGAAAPLYGFSGTPVLVDGAVVGHMIRHTGDPDDRQRPAYGMIFAAPIRGVAALLDVALVGREIHPAKLAATTGFIEAIENSREIDAPKEETLRAAKILIGQNRPDLALELLNAREQEPLEAKQMRALALAKGGKTDESIRLLKGLVGQGHKDPETLGLLAGRYKDKWRDKGDKAALHASYQTYRETFDRTKNPFNGINAAATALWTGERAQSVMLAHRALQSLKRKEKPDHWDLATIGEAWLLQGKLEKARELYQKAVAKEPDLYQDIAVMRRQARVNLKFLGMPPNALDDVLPVPAVLAFAGHMLDERRRRPQRFPDRKIAPVRLAIRAKLEELGFVQGFGTAAKGSDIIFLEEMVRRQVKPLVVMPFPEEDFRRVSVGEEWGRQFDAIRSKLEVMVLEPQAPPENQLSEAFRKSNERIFCLAIEHAKRLDETPRLLAVWDGKPKGDGPGGTADVVRLWQAEGYKPIVIDINVL